jgi:hypothetical protein
LPAEWEVRDLALGLGRQLELLGPALGGFATEAWVDAPAAYGEQRDSARREATAVAELARAAAQKPRGLGKAFELQLRLQQIGVLIASLVARRRPWICTQRR